MREEYEERDQGRRSEASSLPGVKKYLFSWKKSFHETKKSTIFKGFITSLKVT